MLTFFTPSFSGDLERFILLRKSMDRFYQGNAKHIVAVPKEDLRLFKRSAPNDSDVEYITQNELVDKAFFPPWWYAHANKLFPSQAWRLEKFKGRSGWIIQIMVKLSVSDVAPAGAVALLDSDLVFVRDFKNSDLGNPEEQRILVRAIPKTESGKHRGHVEKSRQIFKLPAGSTEHHYMSSPNIWYTDWVNALHEYLERNYGDKWQNVLYQAGHISAYTLYGTFVDEVLNPPELIRRPKSFHEIVWDMNSYNRFISGEIGSSPEILCVVIQSNLGIPVKEYTARIEELWSRT